MKLPFYKVLNVAKNATRDEIKQAYRKLASIHHPDKGGNKEEFQLIQEAYSALIKRKKIKSETSYFGTAYGSQTIEKSVSLLDAFLGNKINVSTPDGLIETNILKGIPNHHCYLATYDDKHFLVRVNIDLGEKYKWFDISNHEKMNIFSGDLEQEIYVDVLDLIGGAYISLKSFDGNEHIVRIPEGFNPINRIKVESAGYYSWKFESISKRGNLYLKIVPEIKRPCDLNYCKLKDIYERACLNGF